MSDAAPGSQSCRPESDEQVIAANVDTIFVVTALAEDLRVRGRYVGFLLRASRVLQQQAWFDDFITRYNTDRPHQALGMKVPADLYARSPRVYRGLEELTYPFHDQTNMVTGCGRICFLRPEGEPQSCLRRSEPRRHASQ